MSNTPETDAKAHSIFGNHSCATVLADFARKLERERDEARKKLADALQEVDFLTLDYERIKEQNAKLRDIAERAIGLAVQYYECERDAAELRAELDQLKEEVK